MDFNEFQSWLTDGLDETEKAVVLKAIQRDVVKNRATTLKAQSEFDAIVAQQNALKAELEGDQAAGKPGTRAYREWYEKNSAAILANDKAIKDFEAKYGKDSFAKAVSGELQVGAPAAPIVNPNSGSATLTEAQVQALVDARIAAGVKPSVAEADIQRMVNDRIQKGYAPRWGDLVTGAAKVVQKHMFAGRKNPIDMDVVTNMATEKFNGNLEQAYDEWDKPERDKVEAESRKAEIENAVKAAKATWDEEQKKANSARLISGGADATPSALSVHKGAGQTFDKNSLVRDLAVEWAGGGVQ